MSTAAEMDAAARCQGQVSLMHTMREIPFSFKMEGHLLNVGEGCLERQH